MEGADKAQPYSLSPARKKPAVNQVGENHMGMADDELLTVEQAAEVLGVGVQRMYNLRNLGHGPVSYRRGRRLVYPRSGLAAFLVRELQTTLKGEGTCHSTTREHDRTMRNGTGSV
jgi:hypothetical protein